ncbi:MAG: CDP-alcohol phosphatidyltransferase family protein [Candidatus Omnitrophota bacterium]|nr:MAG: CDP-alcohol phosphatidyltransferase family protein [Candidatus Omnitrophota bacterium]
MSKIRSQKPGNFAIKKLARFLSIRIALFLKDFNISPNQLTLISFFVGASSAASFSVGQMPFNVLGVFLFLLSYLLDFIDGDVARLKNQTSQFGEWLDAVTGKVESVLLILGICLGQMRCGSPQLIWLLGFITISGYYVGQSLMYKNSILYYKRALKETSLAKEDFLASAPPKKKKSIVRKLIGEVFIGGHFIPYALVVTVLLDRMLLFLWCAAVYMWFDYLLQVFFTMRGLKRAKI